MGRAEQLLAISPQLVADVTLYTVEKGGRKSAALPGWGCPCCVSRQEPITGYDGWPLLGDTAIEPGEQRRIGFVFLSGEEAVAEAAQELTPDIATAFMEWFFKR
jgi:hypothetical protein